MVVVVMVVMVVVVSVAAAAVMEKRQAQPGKRERERGEEKTLSCQLLHVDIRTGPFDWLLGVGGLPASGSLGRG